MIKNVTIKPGCISCKNCERICPQVFKITGISQVIWNEFDKYKDALLKAYTSCPVWVICMEASSSKKILPWIQQVLLIASLLTPLQYVFLGNKFLLWEFGQYALIILMLIRPLRDIFPNIGIFAKLMPLRRELWIFSASIVVSAALINYLDPNFSFFSTYFSINYWSHSAFWARIWELTGFILLLTSNIFSKQLLWDNWKRIQKLSYLYFFAGFVYIWIAINNPLWIIAIWLVSTVTFYAYLKNNFFTASAE